MKRVEIYRPFCAALLIAIGVAIVWGLLTGWGWGIAQVWTQSSNQVDESLEVMRDGTVVISSRNRRNYEDVSYRTLEGKSIEISPDDQASPASLPESANPRKWFDVPIGWGESLSSSDYRRPPAGWYLIRNNQPDGRAYFVGYDETSRMEIGYIGLGGFRRSLPPKDEWFNLGTNRLGWGGGAVTSTGYLMPNAPANRYTQMVDTSEIPSWMVYLIDGDRVLEIDLRNRSVRPVFESPGLVSVGWLSARVMNSEGDELAAGDDKKKFGPRLAVRLRERIVVMNPMSDEQREFPLPESLRGESLSAYMLPDHELLLQWYPAVDEHRETRLMWLGGDGKVVREENPDLTSYSGSYSPRTEAMLAATWEPVPLGWYVVTGAIAPLAAVANGQEPTYAAAITKLFGMASPAVILVTAVGCIAAWLVWRWQRTCFRRATGGWCWFAFLFGVPGLIAYWLEYRRAKLELCAGCNRVVPRDRDACASCKTPFPVPPLVGKEIFA